MALDPTAAGPVVMTSALPETHIYVHLGRFHKSVHPTKAGMHMIDCMQQRRTFILVLSLLSLTACQLSSPSGVTSDASPPRTPDELWRFLASFEMEPRRSSTAAMIAVADFPRKRADLSDEACKRPRRHAFLDDGGATLIDIDLGDGPRSALFKAPAPGKAAIILVHGLFDSKFAGYLDTTATLLERHGYGVLVPDMRWHGCRMEDSPPSLGPQEARDLAELARWIRARHSDSAVGLIGFSLGGQVVGHALAREDAEELFAAGGVAFSPPGDLQYTLDWLDRRPADVFALAFRGWIKRRMRGAEIPWNRGAEFRSAIEWLADRWGYSSSGEFLVDVDLGSVLPKVSRPLQMYVSADDPYFTSAATHHLRTAAEANLCANVQVTPFGGHIGHAIVDPKWFSTSILMFFATSSELSCALHV